MNIEAANEKLKDLGITLNKDAKTFIENINSVGNILHNEGILKLCTIEYKKLPYLMWASPLKVVSLPIILNNAGINYFLFVGQSRFSFGEKVSLEVNRGFVTNNNIDESLYWESLLMRKVPYLLDYASIFKVEHLGNFWQHPDITPCPCPIQAVFAKTTYDMEIPELKKVLKSRHDYLNEPRSGPPLHNTEPVLKSFEEVNLRLNEITFNAEKTKDEFYINDLFSMTALVKVIEYIKLNGMPF